MTSRGWISRLRRRIQRNRYSSNPLLRASTRLLRVPLYVWQAATDGFYRSTLWNRLRQPGDVHLTCNYTREDRYPQTFSAVREHLADPTTNSAPNPTKDATPNEQHRLLSFGCSTGEEAFTLRRYFPSSTIVGADISAWNLRQARRRNRDPQIRFVESTAQTLDGLGPFDAIFCMAVLMRIAHRMEPAPSSAGTYPFDQYQRQLAQLDGLLRTGGLLIVHHANYRFTDSSIAGRYRSLGGAFDSVDQVPKYGVDNRLLGDTDFGERIFVKLR